MVSFGTIGKYGYSVRFSPFNPALLAVATSEQFGLSGSGTLFILYISSNGTIQEIGNHQWANGLFDVCWSAETNTNCVLTASGDGSLQIWALPINKEPIAIFLGHNKEVSCIDWKVGEFTPLILSGSWDKTIKLWDINTRVCLTSFFGHTDPVHDAKYSPNQNIIASVSGDRTMKLWSMLSASCLKSIQVHDAEVLSCDWCKYDSNLIATSGSDSLIRCWDIRNYRQPLFQIKGSEQAVKQIKFSPHFAHIIASASFDFTTKIWDLRQRDPLEVFQHHSEFVYGLDWNNQEIGLLADCSWDSTVQVFKSKVLRNMKNKM